MYLALVANILNETNMEEKCLASELLYVEIILLVLSKVFFKSPKSIPTSSKNVLYEI